MRRWINLFEDRSFERLTWEVSQDYAGNAQGQCEGASADLAERLAAEGTPCRVIQGLYDGEPHVWVEIEGYILDPTVEQFESDEMVLPKSSPEADHYEYHDDLAENADYASQYWVTVYHGDTKENAPLHEKMFFSSDRGFASDYGLHITTYELNVLNFADTLDPELIEQFLPLHDHYDDRDIDTMSDYMDRSSDTWEMIEEVADDIVHMIDAAGLIIYEGGCKNYMVYDTNCLRSKAITEEFSGDLFHGTTHDFEAFDLAKIADGGAYGAGFYFSNDLSLGRTYSDGKDPVRASVKLDNPWIVDLDLDYVSDERRAQSRVFRNKGARDRLIEQGYDGVLVKQGRYVEVVAYYPEQITIKGRDNKLSENRTYFGGFKNPPTRSVAVKYLTGWCPYFAMAVYDLYGGQIIFNGQHFGVQFGEKFVDSRGITAADEWPNITPITRDEMVEEIESGHYKCGYYEERELAKAKRLVKSVGIQFNLCD